jgi:uncharacterized protein
MLFRRRKPAALRERILGLIWPRKGFLRPLHYFRMRVLRLTASPHAIAAGVTAGVVSSWTPFIGFHFILAFVLAYLIAGNLIAATLGTAFGNPLTFPFIWASTWEVGNFILGTERSGSRQIDLVGLFNRLDLWQLWGPVLKPMLIGAAPLAAVSGALVYSLTYYGVRGFQARRRARLAARARARLVNAGVIVGIGSDLVDIRRVEKSVDRFGERFTARCFTDIERARSDGRANRAQSYAKRFAAKEACSKALGTGVAQGVFWKDMGVVNLPGGKPTMVLTGGALACLQQLLPPGHDAVIHLSITDDHPYAQAFVVIEARPAGPRAG